MNRSRGARAARDTAPKTGSVAPCRRRAFVFISAFGASLDHPMPLLRAKAWPRSNSVPVA
jgi:hypothetical protein